MSKRLGDNPLKRKKSAETNIVRKMYRKKRAPSPSKKSQAKVKPKAKTKTKTKKKKKTR